MPPVNPAAAPEVIDPVCGMSILPSAAIGPVTHRGHTYHFCSQTCVDKFSASPETYLTPPTSRPPSAPAPPLTTSEWTCPMPPEVVRDEPGSCPICGMALEPRVVTASVRLEIPDGVTALDVEATPGATFATEKRGDRVVAILWTKEIPPREMAQFVFRAQNPAKGGEIVWKAHQHFSDRTVADLVNPTGDKRPAPVTKLTATPADYRDRRPGPELKAFENLQFGHTDTKVTLLLGGQSPIRPAGRRGGQPRTDGCASVSA